MQNLTKYACIVTFFAIACSVAPCATAAEDIREQAPALPSKALILEVPFEIVSGFGTSHSGGARYLIIREVLTTAPKLVIGYDDERKVMIMHDPSFGPALEMSYEDFDRNWRLDDYIYVAKPPEGFADFVARRSARQPYPPRSADMQAAFYFASGYGYSEIGRGVDAEREFEKGLALPGVGKSYRHVLAVELALHRRAAGRVEDAIALLRQAIAALPEAPLPYQLLVEIYRANSTLPDAEQAAAGVERQWKPRSTSREAFSTWLRTLPRDFHLLALTQYRGWACEPDFRGSRC